MALSPALRGMVSKAKNKYQNNNGKTVKPKEGRNTFRILAPTPEQADWVPATGQFWRDLGVHWIKPDENAKPSVVLGDSEIVFDKPCVVNTAIQMAIESAMTEEDKKLYESWRSRKTVLINALDRNDNDNHVVLELTATTFGKYLDLLEIHADAGVDITSQTEGLDIIITRSGKGLQTEYDVAAAPGVSKPVTSEQMQGAQDLVAFIEANYFRGEEQKALNAISSITGIAVPALPGAAGASTPTAALTSGAASVEGAAMTGAFDSAPVVDASSSEAQAQADLAAKAEAEAKVAAELEARRAELLAKQKAELAALSGGTPAAEEKPAEEQTASGLASSEEDALLAELEGLTSTV